MIAIAMKVLKLALKQITGIKSITIWVAIKSAIVRNNNFSNDVKLYKNQLN